MTGIVEFIRARLDEDEAIAHAADGPAWESGDGNVSEGGLYAREWSIAWFDLGETNPEGRIRGENWERHAHENSVHAARHDPARVLRDVEAKRRIVDEYDESNDREVVMGLRPAVEALASVWSDHPDYNASWRP